MFPDIGKSFSGLST